MKIIIAGDGKVGSTLARELSAEGYEVTVVDSSREVLEATEEAYDLMTVFGNCASMEILEHADIYAADLLIAATSADEINLLCCVTAHYMNPKLHTIARIRNPEYTGQVYTMREQYALSMVINPERQAAREIERLLTLPGFLRRTTFAKGRVELVELRVDEGSKLAGLVLRNLDSVAKCKVLVCTVQRNGEAIMPDGNFTLQVGDRILVTAATSVLVTLLRNLGIITHKAHRVMLAGGGRVSYYLAELLSQTNCHVKLIDIDPARCAELSELLPKVEVIRGDASSESVLIRENIADCDALVSLTGFDEMNMMISMYAGRIGVPQIITKVSRIGHNAIVDMLPIGSVICPKELCCNQIVSYVRAMKNQVGAARSVHSIAGGATEAIEFVVTPETRYCGETLKKINLRKNVLVTCISHSGSTEIASGDSRFYPGDTLIIVASAGTIIGQLNDIFA